jgi:protein O-GlcNAc transferase
MGQSKTEEEANVPAICNTKYFEFSMIDMAGNGPPPVGLVWMLREYHHQMSNKDNIRAALEAGLRHHQAGQLAEAKRFYGQALEADARQADALHLLGVIALQTGDNHTAVKLIEAAIEISPLFATYYSNLGNALQALGQFEACASAYEAAIRLRPDYAEAHYNLGIALMDLSRFDAALAAYDTAIGLKPDYADAFSNRGKALLSLGRADDAIASFETAIRLRPDYAAGHYKLGDALLALRRFNAAIAAYDTAIRLKPDHFEALSNRGNALMNQGRPDAALASYQTAISANPELASAHYNLGTALQALSRFNAAIACYEAAIRLKPDYTKPHSNLVMCLHYQPGNDEDVILKAARRYAAHIEPRPRSSFGNSAEPDRRLRIGYVSGDLYRHTIADYLRPVLSHHDPEAMEVFCYSNSQTTDDMTDRLRTSAHHWRNVADLQDAAAAAQIIADGIDILVDLSGHTNGNRLPVFAGRSAPVQATWLGFWGTTGLAAMDYILSDEDTIPPGHERYYSERVLRLPGGRFCYQPPEYAPAPVPPPSLAGGGTTFGSFNNLAKIGPEVIRLWAQVLHAVPGSRLLLKWKTLASAPVRQELAAAFVAAGIEANRLVLRGDSPHEAMLAEYGDVDIALDPFPFSGGVTSCEALWMGVPVVTLPGPSAASRQTLGFLRAIGQRDWVARSQGDYIHAVAALAEDKKRLAERRAIQRQRMALSPLCDGRSFTRQLEAAYRTMWRD